MIYRFALAIDSGVYKLMFNLTVVNKILPTVTFGCHDSISRRDSALSVGKPRKHVLSLRAISHPGIHDQQILRQPVHLLTLEISILKYCMLKSKLYYFPESKCTEQTVRMCKLVCPFFVRKQQNRVFLGQDRFYTYRFEQG